MSVKSCWTCSTRGHELERQEVIESKGLEVQILKMM